MNWYVGWTMILTAFITGAVIGIFFHNEDFLGGYHSFRRRILRLGHIALAALGMMNILFYLAYVAADPSTQLDIASLGFVIGGIAMPSICFLSAWRASFRHLFFVPVVALVIAVIQTLRMDAP